MQTLLSRLPDYSSPPARQPQGGLHAGFLAGLLGGLQPAKAGPASAPSKTPLVSPLVSPLVPPPAAQVPNLQALILEAETAARMAGKAEAQAQFEQQRVKDNLLFEQRLGEARQEWAAQEGAHLSTALSDGFKQLQDDLAGSLGRVIGPFLANAVRERALTGMTEAISRAVLDPETPLLRVVGAADLIAELQQRVAADAAVSFEAAEMNEVVLVAGATTFETQMRAWTERLGAAQD